MSNLNDVNTFAVETVQILRAKHLVAVEMKFIDDFLDLHNLQLALTGDHHPEPALALEVEMKFNELKQWIADILAKC